MEPTIYTTVRSELNYHPHYCRGQVHISREYATGSITVRAYIGTAPDSTTIIVYPYEQYACGYMNKGTARKLAATLKANLKVFVKANGIKLSEPIEVLGGHQ
jgi:hypothetical protein